MHTALHTTHTHTLTPAPTLHHRWPKAEMRANSPGYHSDTHTHTHTHIHTYICVCVCIYI
jgi:hypothetical protein